MKKSSKRKIRDILIKLMVVVLIIIMITSVFASLFH